MAQPQPFDDIALRRDERGLLVGGTRSGKSTLAEHMIGWWLRKYPTGRCLIADTKPRFRAEFEQTGLSAKRRYRKWTHGAPMPGSVLVDHRDPRNLKPAFALSRLVVMQGARRSDRVSMFAMMDRHLEDVSKKIPDLLYVDETKDFYGTNGQPLAGAGEFGDVIERFARAGGERGAAVLASTQRPAGIPVALRDQLSRLYLFQLDNEDDAATVHRELSAPRDMEPPDEVHTFVYYERATRQWRRHRLRLP